MKRKPGSLSPKSTSLGRGEQHVCILLSKFEWYMFTWGRTLGEKGVWEGLREEEMPNTFVRMGGHFPDTIYGKLFWAKRTALAEKGRWSSEPKITVHS